MKKWIWFGSAILLILISGAVGFWAADAKQDDELTGQYSNILVFDQFNDQSMRTVPYGYAVFGDGEVLVDSIPAATNRSVRISSVDNAGLRKTFPAQAATFTTEVKFMQQEISNTGIIYLLDRSKQAIKIDTEDGNLIYRSKDEDQVLLEGYEKDAWYVIKIVADPSNNAADVYVNGTKMIESEPFLQKVNKINTLESISMNGSAHYIDDVYVISGEIDIPIGFGSLGKLPTGGHGGEIVVSTNAEELGQYVLSDDPYIILIDGDITLPIDMLSVRSNKSIIGLGDNATIRNGGLRIRYADNVVIRNIHFTEARDDSIEVRGSSHVWIDHNTFSNGYDGLLDVRNGSNFVTISWNKFENHTKTSLVGHADGNLEDRGKLKVTYHHNWFHETDQRHPRVRYGEVHVLNNFYDAVGLYGIRAATEASVMAEANVFYNTKLPIELYPEYTGQVEEKNNVYDNAGEPQLTGNVFDPYSYYTYPVDQADSIAESVKAGAGAGVLDFSSLRLD